MKDYFSMNNLKQATLLGMVVGAMAVPRILQAAGPGSSFRVLAVFPSMIIVAAAATAWGRCGGMSGPFPEWKTMRSGILAGLLAGILMAVMLSYDDARMISLLRQGGSADAVTLSFPATVDGGIASVLWSAGFETLFFIAATMSFLARVSRRLWITISLAVCFRILVAYGTASSHGVEGVIINKLGGLGIGTLIACLLYARTGLPSAMVMSAAVNLRHLVRVLMEGS